ncbi:NAD(P)-binding protein [Durotheca rogersii]|uniref:NAD(P)-binding protein n=1 Tax=Durotheca rogersii TaxID=419775 RepID=UPI00221E621E|nr:NAD(P)-binding protein [Durotheca rogersii]KAI5863998.1 NAD(P)-binding protein [Durotheca rogersii]
MSQNNYVKKVAIVGAAGTVGTYIVEELLKTGKHEITAVTRKDSQAVIPAGLKVAKVDYEDESTLVSALQGQEVLIITMHIRAPQGTQEKLIRAAAAANVPYVLPNEWSPDMADEAMSTDIILGHAEIATRKLIEELGKSSWIGMITSFWYEYSLGTGPETFGMDWKKRTWTFFDDGETKINVITWAQTGRAVAKLLSLPIQPEVEGGPSLSGYKNKFVYVSSYLLSQKDMFAVVCRVTGTKASDWTIAYEDSTKRFQDARALVLGGDQTAFVKFLYSRLFFKDGSGNFEDRRGLDNDVLGLPKEDLDASTKAAIDRAEKGLKYH